MRSGSDLQADCHWSVFNHVIDPHSVTISCSLYTTIRNPNAKPDPNPNAKPNRNHTEITDWQISPRDPQIVIVQIRHADPLRSAFWRVTKKFQVLLQQEMVESAVDNWRSNMCQSSAPGSSGSPPAAAYQDSVLAQAACPSCYPTNRPRQSNQCTDAMTWSSGKARFSPSIMKLNCPPYCLAYGVKPDLTKNKCQMKKSAQRDTNTARWL